MATSRWKVVAAALGVGAASYAVGCHLVGDLDDASFVEEGGAGASGAGGDLPCHCEETPLPCYVCNGCTYLEAPKGPTVAGDLCVDGFCDGDGACVACIEAADCPDSTPCKNGVCVDQQCSDMVANGMETDVDCGGPSCPACETGQGCIDGGDCVSQLCKASQCAPCTTDTQCTSDEYCDTVAGECSPKKPDGVPCDSDGECLSGTCDGQYHETCGGHGYVEDD